MIEALRLCLAFLLLAHAIENHACDCAWQAYSNLKRHGIQLKTVPSIAVNDWHKYPGVYSAGVVHVKAVDCRVILHEFVHHAQFERAGNAKSTIEWWQRERDAAIVTMQVETGCQ